MGLKKRLFTIILSCEKYRDKMLSQDTSKLGDHMYFIGDPSLSCPLVKGKVVYLPCPDNYESLTQKSLLAIKWAVENKKFDLLLKTDDDVVFLDCFGDIVNQASKYDYSGLLGRGGYHSTWHIGKCENKELHNYAYKVPEVYYCIGGAYFLSRKAASIIAGYKIRPNHCIFEDAEVGDLLTKSGITANKINIRAGFSWPQ